MVIKGFGHKFPNNLRVRAKNNFRGSFQGVRVKIENQDKTNMDFFQNSGTTGSNFWYLICKSPKNCLNCFKGPMMTCRFLENAYFGVRKDNICYSSINSSFQWLKTWVKNEFKKSRQISFKLFSGEMIKSHRP